MHFSESGAVTTVRFKTSPQKPFKSLVWKIELDYFLFWGREKERQEDNVEEKGSVGREGEMSRNKRTLGQGKPSWVSTPACCT